MCFISFAITYRIESKKIIIIFSYFSFFQFSNSLNRHHQCSTQRLFLRCVRNAINRNRYCFHIGDPIKILFCTAENVTHGLLFHLWYDAIAIFVRRKSVLTYRLSLLGLNEIHVKTDVTNSFFLLKIKETCDDNKTTLTTVKKIHF